MSFEAMAWAVKQKTANPGQQLVLLLLANHANGYSGQCNPSHKLLAEECRMGISTLKNHINGLQDIGLLSIEHRSKDGVSLPNQYILNIGVGQNLTEGGSESDRGVGQNLATNLEVKPVIETSLPGSIQTIPFDKIIDAYELRLPNSPVVRKSLFLNGSSAKETKQRYQWVMSSKHERGPRAGQRLAETEEQAVEWFDKFFGYVAQSDFLAKQFRCNLKWLMNRENFEKVLSGQYHKEQ